MLRYHDMVVLATLIMRVGLSVLWSENLLTHNVHSSHTRGKVEDQQSGIDLILACMLYLFSDMIVTDLFIYQTDIYL